MNEAELSAYCRERGLYPEQVEAWRDACMNANEDTAAQAKQLRKARKAEQKRFRQLERELRRKDKALAETAALLALSKKPRRSGARPTMRTTDQPPGFASAFAEGEVSADRRPDAERPEPANKLSPE